MTATNPIGCTDAEWRARVDLAAAYRLTHHFGMTTLTYNHITARVPGTDDKFLINAFGLGYDEVTASNLVKLNLDGKVLGEGPRNVNFAGYVIHSAVHGARHDVHCVMHTHTPYGMAVSALEEGLVPIQQEAYKFHERLAYHEYEGIAFNVDERERLVTDLGDKDAMILRNHGLLTVGATVADAWQTMWQLERACQVQVLAQSTGQAVRQAPLAAIERTAGIFAANDGAAVWPWLLRTLDRTAPEYRE